MKQLPTDAVIYPRRNEFLVTRLQKPQDPHIS